MSRAQMRLRPVASEVGAARVFIRSTLRDWGIAGILVDDLELVATELVTNALIHARGEARLALSRSAPDAVRLTVSDSSKPWMTASCSTRPPLLNTAGDDAQRAHLPGRRNAALDLRQRRREPLVADGDVDPEQDRPKADRHRQRCLLSVGVADPSTHLTFLLQRPQSGQAACACPQGEGRRMAGGSCSHRAWSLDGPA